MIDKKDIKFIRKTYRLLGSFVGSTNWLGAGYQNKIHGLPLQLMLEECLFLLDECSDVRLLRRNEKELQPQQIANYANEFGEFEQQFLDEYRRLHRLSTIEAIKAKLPMIAEGKAKKAKLPVDQIDREQILENEIDRIKPVGLPKQLLIQSPWPAAFSELDRSELLVNCCRSTSSPRLTDGAQSAKSSRLADCDESRQDEQKTSYRSLPNGEHSLLRYVVYRDLNKKGLYLTKGNKFGSDFLAYPTDPLFTHALYLVVCLSENQQLSKTLLHTYTRLGSQVNKHVLLVRFRADECGETAGDRQSGEESLDDLTSKLEYMVIKWQS